MAAVRGTSSAATVVGLCALLACGQSVGRLAAQWAEAAAYYEALLEAGRRMHEDHRAAVATLSGDRDAEADPAARADANGRVTAEAKALEDAAARLTRARAAVERAIAAGQPDAVRAAIDAARSDLDGAVKEVTPLFGATVQALDRLRQALVSARLRRFPREGGTRLVQRVYFVTSSDRLLLPAARPALDDIREFLGICPESAVAIGALPPRDGPPAAVTLAAERAAEVGSYLMQQGVSPDRIVPVRAADLGPGAAEPEPLAIRPQVTPPKEGEDGRITLTVVRRCSN